MFNYKLSSEFVIIESFTMQRTIIVMHDAIFSDHMRVSMWKFMNSGTGNALYDTRLNGHISVL